LLALPAEKRRSNATQTTLVAYNARSLVEHASSRTLLEVVRVLQILHQLIQKISFHVRSLHEQMLNRLKARTGKAVILCLLAKHFVKQLQTLKLTTRSVNELATMILLPSHRKHHLALLSEK
jgi:hypothetical protein